MNDSILFTQTYHLRCLDWERGHVSFAGIYFHSTSSNRQTLDALCLVSRDVSAYVGLVYPCSQGIRRRPCPQARLRLFHWGNRPDCWIERPMGAGSHSIRGFLASKSPHQACRTLGFRSPCSAEPAKWRSPALCQYLRYFSLTYRGK